MTSLQSKISRNNLEDAIIQSILEILNIQSFTDDPKGIKNAQNFICKLAHRLGFSCRIVANNRVLIVSPNTMHKEPAEIGIVVHLDTVPFDPQEWTHNPLGEISNNRIYGRGVIDDKAPIILAIYAMYDLIRTKKISSSWEIIIGSSEEGVWIDMESYMDEVHNGKLLLPKNLVTLDGDGVQNGCRGYADLTLTWKSNPSSENHLTELYIPNGANNVVPGKAIAIIDGEEIKAIGKPVHSSIPQNGINALILIAHTLEGKTSEFPEFLELMRIIEDSQISKLGFSNHPRILRNQYVGCTTICPTQCKLDGNTLTINLNLRLVAGTTKEEIEQVVKTLQNDFNCTCSIQECTLPAYVPADSEPISYMLEAYKTVLGKETTSQIAQGAGYNAALPNCSIFGPRFDPEHDEEDLCHAADENRKIEDIFKFYDMLCIFIEKMLNKA